MYKIDLDDINEWAVVFTLYVIAYSIYVVLT